MIAEKSTWNVLWEKAKKEPYFIVPGILALLNGYAHKIWFKLTFRKIKLGKGFRVYGTFRVLGPGRVEFGDNCMVGSKLLRIVTIYTVSPKSTVLIGNGVGLNGTVIQCYEAVTIGDSCIIADAFIVDSPAHKLAADRRSFDERFIETYPVKINRNVWISAQVVVLHGVEIGENSVIGACSLVNKNVEANAFYTGIPAVFKKSIDSK